MGLKKMIMNYAESRLDFGGPAPMQVDNLTWTDDENGNGHANNVPESEEVNAVDFNKGKGKGKWGHMLYEASACPRRLECWNCGGAGHRAAECPKGPGKGKGGKGQGGGQVWPPKSWDKGKGKGKPFWAKGQGKNGFGKGPTYAVYDEMEYSGWTNGSGDQALSLFGLADPSAQDRPAVRPQPQITSTANLLDYVKVKPSKNLRPTRTPERKSRNNFCQNRFEALKEDESMEESWIAPTEVEGPPGIPLPRAPTTSTRRLPRTKRQFCTGFDKMTSHGMNGECDCGAPLCLLEVESENLASSMITRETKFTKQESRANGSSRTSPPVRLDTDNVSGDEGKCVDELNAFFEAEPELNTMSAPQWRTLAMVMDSGAAESVAPMNLAPWVSLTESAGSRKGQVYVSASGERIPNLGEKSMEVVTDEGRSARATFQVADVTRALCSISRVCDQGNRVVFESSGGWIESYDGRRTAFKRENNVYVLELHVHDPGHGDRGDAHGHDASGFTRQSK